MNFVTVCAQLREDPRDAFTGAANTVLRCKITLPPYGKKAPTDLELTIYGEKQGNRFRAMKKGMGVYIHGSKLQYDVESKTFSLHGGVVTLLMLNTFQSSTT